MSTLKNYDWKKEAAQSAPNGTANDAVEKAFMDQAYTFISNKCGQLMQNPHRLGFEIVQKNDQNTRMVGIFAFRIGSDLLYAPVFFLNGEIKGTDLLYRHSTKTFVPLSGDWSSFLLEQDLQDEGKGISRDMRNKSPNRVELWRLSHPPGSYNGGYKSASEAGVEFIDGHSDSFTKSATEAPAELKSLLRQFLVEDGGLDAITKLASWMEDRPAFAEAMALNVPEEDYLPEELLEKAGQVKAAAARRPEPELILVTDVMADGLSKSASEQLFKAGYSIIDNRPDEKISFAEESVSDHLTSVGEAGVYSVLTATGEFRKMFVAPYNDTLCDKCSNSCQPCGTAYGSSSRPKPYMAVVDLENHETADRVTDVIGEFMQTVKEAESEFVDKMKTGKAYRIYDSKNGVLTAPVYVRSVEGAHGDITVYTLAQRYNSNLTFKHNKDYDGMDLEEGIGGKDTKFIEVKVKEFKKSEFGSSSYDFSVEECSLGDFDNLDAWIFKQDVKKASLQHRDGQFSFRTGDRTQSRFMGRKEAAILLTRDLGIAAQDAEKLIDKSASADSLPFFYIPAVPSENLAERLFRDPDLTYESLFSKSASPTRILDSENFQDQSDSQFSINMQIPQGFALQTATDQPIPPTHRVGDAWDPSMGHGPIRDSDSGLDKRTLLSSQPEQLGQMAQQMNMPHVFEHGVVGSLVTTYDSVAMIDKYLPDLEQALDKLGRTLFLFYWKPGDFQEAYGVDDMTNLENEILSNFRSFGDLVLTLLKKSRALRRGNVSLPN